MSKVLIEEKMIENSIDGDLLNRQEFIDQVKNIIEKIAREAERFFGLFYWGIGVISVITPIIPIPPIPLISLPPPAKKRGCSAEQPHNFLRG